MESAYFTTEAYPLSARRTAWRKALSSVGVAAQWLSDGPAEGKLHVVRAPLGSTFVRITSRDQRLVLRRTASAPTLWVVLQMDGAGTLRAKDLAYGTSDEDGALALPGTFRVLCARVPLSVVRPRMSEPGMPWSGHVSGNSPLGRLGGAVLASVAETMGAWDDDEARAIESALADLFVAVVRGSTLARHDGFSATPGAQLERIKETVEMRLSEPHLSIADVAVAHRISVRYVQKLFEGAGDSFSHYVRSRRLARCRADLANPLYAHLSISDILFRWGFNDASHFSRAFSAAFGTSPRAYRREAVLQAATDSLHVTRGWPKGTAKTSRAPLVERPAPGGNGRTQRLAKPSIAPRHHRIPANSKTVHWGYFSRGLKPVLQVDSGEVVTIETLTHHAGDDYERMVRGDPGAEDVFLWTKDRKNVERRGSGPMDASIYGRGAGEGFGVHICTGPVAIRGAKPGDVLEVRILDVQLRPCANPRYDGVAFGSNAAAWWGLHYNELLTEPRPREVVTIYRIDPERGDGTPATASAVYNFRWAPQRDPYGVVHSTIDYPGVAVDHATVAERHGVLRDIEIPVFPHFGVIAVAPREAGLVNSVPPSYFGGNIDNRRAGKGATMYLPVGVAGALLSVGDPHAAQGDAELCGTAIECSLTGVFQVIVHERRRLARPALADVSYPLLETAGEWVIHGFSYPNYLSELGDDAQSEIYKKSSLDLAMRDAFRKTRRFLMNFGLSEDEAISLMSVAVDFGITQVVDGNWSVHAVVPKAVLPE